MSSHLLIETTSGAAVLVAVLGIATGVRALASVLRTWIEQASRTRRFMKAIEDARPDQRPEIIMACSQLEGSAKATLGVNTTGGALAAHRDPPPPMLLLHNRRSHVRHRDTMHEAGHSVTLSEHQLIRRLIELVTELDLDRRDFVIFGSGPLLAHGLRWRISDLDVVARGKAWRRVSEHGFPAAGTINGAPLALFCHGLIQLSSGWISEDWDADDLIDRAEMIEGLPFAQLTDVLAYKQQLNRPKDRPDIEALLDLLR
jgi:hypothetical protein